MGERDDQSEGGGHRQGLTIRPSGLMVEIGRRFNPDLRSTRVLPEQIHHTHVVPTREGATTTRQLSSGPNLEPTEISGDDSAVRQRVLVGDPLNDKQWSDDLSDPS